MGKIKVVKKLKKDAWAWFSKYIRLKYADNFGVVECCTCGKRDNWKNMQAGHFVAGRQNSILFEENGVHVQCYACNVCKNGNTLEYFIFMERRYGREEIERLRRLAKDSKKYTREDYLELIDKYKNLAIAESNEKELII